MPKTLAMQQFHFFLSGYLSFQNSIDAAVKFLQGATVGQTPAQVTKDVEVQLRETALRRLVPHIGIVIF
jgi:hypothetical protein